MRKLDGCVGSIKKDRNKNDYMRDKVGNGGYSGQVLECHLRWFKHE